MTQPSIIQGPWAPEARDQTTRRSIPVAMHLLHDNIGVYLIISSRKKGNTRRTKLLVEPRDNQFQTFNNSHPRLAPISSDHHVPQRAAHSGEIGKGCIKSCFGVFILVIAPIAALSGENDSKPNYWLHYHHVNTCTSPWWSGELQFGQCLWQSISPNFGGTGSNSVCKV